tara:strand:- start:117 stop:290 length:174 start_codon:yes stop_codon:yes gene_type:complete
MPFVVGLVDLNYEDGTANCTYLIMYEFEIEPVSTQWLQLRVERCGGILGEVLLIEMS